MHTVARAKPVPVHRDLGFRVALAWLAAVVAFSFALHSQLSGLLTVTPFLAAALSVRVRRVAIVAALSVLAFPVVAFVLGTPWTEAQWIRYGGVIFSGVVATWTGVVRARERRSTIGLDIVAREVQTAVMRLHAPETTRASTVLRYRSADVQSLIGGDALEVVDTKWGLRFLVADACGKGLASMRASTLTLGAFREWAHEEPDLGDLLSRLHCSLDRELDPDDYVTAMVAQLDDLTYTFATAGHPFPLLVRQDEVTELDRDARPTSPLAMRVPRRTPTTGSVGLMAGDVVLMVTDGLLEARDGKGRFFPLEVVASRAFAGVDLATGVDSLLVAASQHARGTLADDIAVAAIRVDDGSRARPTS